MQSKSRLKKLFGENFRAWAKDLFGMVFVGLPALVALVVLGTIALTIGLGILIYERIKGENQAVEGGP